jgi:hypothetical protein
MKLFIDTSRTTFTVTRGVEEKVDNETKRQKTNRATGELLWTVQVMALDASGGEVIMVTLAGNPPKVTVGQTVSPVELEAIPWAQGSRNGVAYRASELVPVGVKSAAS